MPIRNPFARRPGVIVTAHDENSRPGSAAGSQKDGVSPGFERVDTVGSKASSAFSIRSRRSQDTGEYKMSGTVPSALRRQQPAPPPQNRAEGSASPRPSHCDFSSSPSTKKADFAFAVTVVNDSGIYLPPSPIEKEATWPRRYLSRTSSDRSSRDGGGDIEHFPISRESFDSYRRSFDISARSYITDPAPRQSLDSSARFPRMMHTRSSLLSREPPTPEEGFEEVGLGDDSKTTAGQQQQQQQQEQQTGQVPALPRKKGFFAKFGSEHHENGDGGSGVSGGGAAATTTTTSTWSFLPGAGRKRGQSGQGAELGAMPFPVDRSVTGAGGKNAVEVDA
ncbi:hypothetical protein B0T21DRAFT_414825 [Apiosordaria backusii]|uniref:Uncharacterized protein n=1 Tax=Apiosordaria backusii TaxID=314023 RepID=A0AA40DWC9_9PEZI|nr:hypothetical protein B0T21DRAFT_414825 [Apiosordaria backusii]